MSQILLSSGKGLGGTGTLKLKNCGERRPVLDLRSINVLAKLLWRGLDLLSQANVQDGISAQMLALEIGGEHSLKCPEELGGARNQLEIMATWEFLHNKSLSSKEPAFPRNSHGVWENVLGNVAAASFLLSSSMLSSSFILFIFVSFILVLQGWAGVRSGFFPLLLSGILQASWVSCLLEKLGCPAIPGAMECKSSPVISLLF